jgi:hypothetical protein
VIVEKPFGRDSASSAELGRGLAKHLKEEQASHVYWVGCLAWCLMPDGRQQKTT